MKVFKQVLLLQEYHFIVLRYLKSNILIKQRCLYDDNYKIGTSYKVYQYFYLGEKNLN